MKVICGFALVLSVCLAMPGQAQVLEFKSSGLAGDLHCPPTRTALRKPVVPSAPVEVLAPPDPDEIGMLPLAENIAAQPLAFQDGVGRTPDRPLAIAFWGDSHLAANFFGDELVRLSGFPRERVLPTFIPATMGRAGVRLPIRKACQSQGWSYRYAYLAKETGAQFPQGLSLLRSSSENSYLWVDFRLSGQTPALRGVDVFFQPSPGGEPTLLGVTVDDGSEQLVELQADGEGVLQVRVDQAMSVIRLRLVAGSVTLEGFVPQYLEAAPALRMDTFAIPGATAKGWANTAGDYLLRRLGSTQYDLVAFEYGTNEGNSKPFSAAAYASDLRLALSNMRKVFPDARCVLLGPTDRGVLVKVAKGTKTRKGKKGKKATNAQKRMLPAPELLGYARIHHEIGELQRVVGREFSCSYWSWQDAMGGIGSAYRWFYRSPALMAKDLTHLTIPGYQMSARNFAESIRFQFWVGREAREQ